MVLRSLPWLLVAVSATAQTTWIVDAAGGPGVHFLDLPPAVAAALPGDTILVHPAPFLGSYSPFTTSKGLTVVGVGQPFLRTASVPVRVERLPANERFALVGFDAPRGNQMLVVVTDCQGVVLLENLHAVEHGMFPSGLAAIDIRNCALATLRDVEDFGSPAVEVRDSTVVLAACRLGVTSLGLGGGPPLWAADSRVDVAEPDFQATGYETAVRLVRCRSRITGTANSYLQGGLAAPTTGAPAIYELGGTLDLDPRVRLNPIQSSPTPIVGGPGVQIVPVPGCAVARATPGGALQATVLATGGDLVLLALGLPGTPTTTTFGDLFLRPTRLDLALLTTAPAGGTFGANLGTIPPTMPRGLAFGLQPLVLHNGVLRLGVAGEFVLH